MLGLESGLQSHCFCFLKNEHKSCLSYQTRGPTWNALNFPCDRFSALIHRDGLYSRCVLAPDGLAAADHERAPGDPLACVDLGAVGQHIVLDTDLQVPGDDGVEAEDYKEFKYKC